MELHGSPHALFFGSLVFLETFMWSLRQDLHYAQRQMRKSPAFTLVAVLTLALGIGANTAIFLVLHGALRLPFPHADQLVTVRNDYPGSADTPGSLPDFQDWRNQAKSFSSLVAIFPTRMTYLGKHEPVRVAAAYASDGFLPTLGLTPLLGRGFVAGEHQKGAAPAYVLSEEFWKNEFGADPAVLGRTITLNGRPGTVVGVVPRMVPSFYFEPQVWLPLEAAPPYDQHGTNYLSIVGRLKDGVSLASARSELTVIQGQIDKQFPANAHGISLRLLAQAMFGDVRSVTLVLLAAVGFILLIACLNLANMLLARATDRLREFAIRNALGASMGRLLQQTITESMLLAFLGGILGLVFAVAITRLPLAVWPKFLLRPDQVTLDGTVILFTAGLALLTGLFFGVIPALYVLRENFFTATREGRTLTESREQGLTRSVLMVSEIALATLLVAGALSMARYFTQLMHTDPGINPDHVLSMNVSLSPARYATEEQQRQFFQQLLDRLSTLPGVSSVAAASDAPFGGDAQSSDFEYEGQTGRSGQLRFATDLFVSPNYFETMQVPVLQGRSFDQHDQPTAPKVVVINRTMAESLWPGQNAIGKRLTILGEHQVVGVVADVRAAGVAQPAGFQVYFSSVQHTPSDMTLLMRTTVEPLSVGESAKRTVYAIDPQQAVSNVASADQLASNSIAAQRVSTALSGSLGGLALLLASIGVYGVMAYSVSRREREFGIRMAMGARPIDILSLLMRRSGVLVLIGVAAGVALTVPLSRSLSALLAGSHTFGVLTIAASGILSAGVAMLATYLPARRATAIQPMTALRTD
jgi:putative ABC transport system permease protein